MPRPAAPVPQACDYYQQPGCAPRITKRSILTDPSGVLMASSMDALAMAVIRTTDTVIGNATTFDDDTDPRRRPDPTSGSGQRSGARRAAEVGQMGATVVWPSCRCQPAHVVWAGDCRAYLMRGGRLRLLTRDHSLVQDLIERSSEIRR